jgi:hypothetical protein
MRGTWFAIVQVILLPESHCLWAGTLEIPTQDGGSFTGAVEVDLEDDIPGLPDLEPPTECFGESTLQEPVTGSITVDGDITLVLGSPERMRELIEAVTMCPVILPVEELSGFVTEIQEGDVVERDFLTFSFNTEPEKKNSLRGRFAAILQPNPVPHVGELHTH